MWMRNKVKCSQSRGLSKARILSSIMLLMQVLLEIVVSQTLEEEGVCQTNAWFFGVTNEHEYEYTTFDFKHYDAGYYGYWPLLAIGGGSTVSNKASIISVK